MDYDFDKFLKESESSCKTKADFVGRINDEEDAVSKINDGQNFIERQLYLKRLDNAKFCTEKGAMKEKDMYNADLLKLLGRLK